MLAFAQILILKKVDKNTYAFNMQDSLIYKQLLKNTNPTLLAFDNDSKNCLKTQNRL